MGMAKMETSFSDLRIIHMSETDPATPDGRLDQFLSFDDDSSHPTLAFVAIWDPEEDVVFVSQRDIDQDSDLASIHAPYPNESISEFHTLDFPSVAPSMRSSICYQILRDGHDPLFTSLTMEQRSLRGMTQTSSTLGGLDVYLKGAALSHTHRHQPAYSVLDFSTDFEFDPRPRVVSERDPDGVCHFGRRSALHLNTSLESTTSGTDEDRFSISWSAIESPTVEELESMKKSSDSLKSRSGRKLKKRRPGEVVIASPSEVPDIPRSPVISRSHCTRLSGKHIFRGVLGFGKLARRLEDDWVWVEWGL
ncbi:hypothetical protein BDZ97DRAFT_1753623 [Flammula alnicola]|nr:hypothetical protein BDZ97DRAFT_1753623 [Flammula alnicola]